MSATATGLLRKNSTLKACLSLMTCRFGEFPLLVDGTAEYNKMLYVYIRDAFLVRVPTVFFQQLSEYIRKNKSGDKLRPIESSTIRR